MVHVKPTCAAVCAPAASDSPATWHSPAVTQPHVTLEPSLESVSAAPVVGAAAGTGFGTIYEDLSWNRTVDNAIEGTLGQWEPYLASGSRFVGSGIGRAADWVISVGSSAFNR